MTTEELQAIFDDVGLPNDGNGRLARQATINKLKALEAKGQKLDGHLECLAGTYFDGFYDCLTFYWQLYNEKFKQSFGTEDHPQLKQAQRVVGAG